MTESPEPVQAATPSPAQPRNLIAATVAAAIIGFCAWMTVFALKHNDGPLDYKSAEHRELLKDPRVGMAPGAAEWGTKYIAATQHDSPITGALTFGALGALLSLALPLPLWGIGGVRPRNIALLVVAAIVLTAMSIGLGWCIERFNIWSATWVTHNGAEKQSVDVEIRLLICEGIFWAILGLGLALYALIGFGRPGPALKSIPGLALLGALGGVIATCAAMAVTMQLSEVKLLMTSLEIAAIIGLGSAFLCGALTWKAISH